MRIIKATKVTHCHLCPHVVCIHCVEDGKHVYERINFCRQEAQCIPPLEMGTSFPKFCQLEDAKE